MPILSLSSPKSGGESITDGSLAAPCISLCKDYPLKKLLLPILGIMAIAATGCSGNSGTATPTAIGAPTTGYPAVSPPGTTTAPASSASVVFTIQVPAKTTAANTRKPDYVSSGTQSVSIALTSVNSTAFNAVAPKQVACTSAATCTVTFSQLPTGTDGFTVTTYSTATLANQSAANALSTNNITASVAVATVTTVPLTLQGIINSLGVTVNTPALVAGTSKTDGVVVVANDQSGATIIGSATYNNGPIVVTTDDAFGAITGLTNLTSPAGTETLSYNGTSIPATEHVIATVGTITASGLIPITNSTESLSTTATSLDATPNALSSVAGSTAVATGGDAIQVIKATQSGWGSALSHPFTIGNTCGAAVVVANPTTDTFTLTSSAAAATCAVTFIGGGGATAVLNITQSASTDGVNVPVTSVNRKP